MTGFLSLLLVFSPIPSFLFLSLSFLLVYSFMLINNNPILRILISEVILEILLKIQKGKLRFLAYQYILYPWQYIILCL